MYPTPYDDPIPPFDKHPLDYAKKRSSRAIETLLLKPDGRYEILEVKGGHGVQDITVKVRPKRDVYDTRPISEIDSKDLRIRDIRYHRFTVQEVLDSKFPNGIEIIPANLSGVIALLSNNSVTVPTDTSSVQITDNSFTLTCTDPDSLFWTGSGTVSLGTGGGGSEEELWSIIANFIEASDGLTADMAAPSINPFTRAIATSNPSETGFRINLAQFTVPDNSDILQVPFYIFLHTDSHDAAVVEMIRLFSDDNPNYAFFFDLQTLLIQNTGTIRRMSFNAALNAKFGFLYTYGSDDPAPVALNIKPVDGYYEYSITAMVDGIETVVASTMTMTAAPELPLVMTTMVPNGYAAGPQQPFLASFAGG